MNPIIAEALKPFTPSRCFMCPTIEKGVCMLGQKCIHYDGQRLETEIERRHEEKVERIRKSIMEGT